MLYYTFLITLLTWRLVQYYKCQGNALVRDSLLTNQNSIQVEIKCRLKAGNSCYYSVQKLLSSLYEFEN